ncbi:hypothetical protein ACFQH5_20455 [Halomonas salifodinae]|uniref:Uncharacterized protein n=1 Tax=Halomonas salifodinae TaxID=438745 RepID=A0ABW2F4P0_9GAMM
MSTPETVSVSISRPSRGDGREVMTIKVIDTTSRLPVVEFDMPLDDFMKCLTGQAEMPAEVTRFTPEDKRNFLGMTRVNRTVECGRVHGKEEQREVVLRHFATLEPGWYLFSDGTGSQQRGEHHQYIVHRWEEP